jgi:hypothetical protein
MLDLLAAARGIGRHGDDKHLMPAAAQALGVTGDDADAAGEAGERKYEGDTH